MLALDLLEELEDDPETAVLVERLFLGRKRKLIERNAYRMEGKSLREKVTELAAIQNDGGYMVELHDEDDVLILNEYNCPMSKRWPSVIGMPVSASLLCLSIYSMLKWNAPSVLAEAATNAAMGIQYLTLVHFDYLNETHLLILHLFRFSFLALISVKTKTILLINVDAEFQHFVHSFPGISLAKERADGIDGVQILALFLSATLSYLFTAISAAAGRRTDRTAGKACVQTTRRERNYLKLKLIMHKVGDFVPTCSGYRCRPIQGQVFQTVYLSL